MAVERGKLRVLVGNLAAAGQRYQTAGRAYFGHCMLEERLAEMEALEGRITEAITRLERVVERTRRPEASQALASLYDPDSDTGPACFPRAPATGDLPRLRADRRTPVPPPPRTSTTSPDDVAVTGWDDSDAAAATGLTTVAQSLRDQGARCARIALGRAAAARVGRVAWRVVVRSSTRQPRT